MYLGDFGAAADWIQGDNVSEGNQVQHYWLNTITNEIRYTAPPPDFVPTYVAPASTASATVAPVNPTSGAAPGIYAWGWYYPAASLDYQNQQEVAGWLDISDPRATSFSDPPANAPAPPGFAVKYVGDVNESSMSFYGNVFQDAAGNYYNDGAIVTRLTKTQIQNALQGAATALKEASVHDSVFNSPLTILALPLLIYGLPALMAATSGEATATAAATAGSGDTSALVAALDAQDAAQVALEQAIADVNGSLATSSVADVAQQASNVADALSSHASAVGETIADPAAQAAAQAAQGAAANLQTAASAAGTASTASTAAGLLSALRTAGSAAAAIGSILAVARGTGGQIRPVTTLPPGYQSPYLTQASAGSTNNGMLLLAAGVAAVFLLRGK